MLVEQESNKKPITVITTKQFQKELAKLYDDERFDLVDKVSEILVDLCNFSVGKKYRNHPLTNAKGYNELHISGDVLLLYKYEGDILTVELKLARIVNHKKLKKINYRKMNREDTDVLVKNIRNPKKDDIDGLINNLISKNKSESKFKRWW